MRIYLELLDKILKQGQPKDNRTGTPVLSLFGERMEFDLAAGFPLLTTKRVYLKGVLAELLWFIKGDTNLDYLHKNNCHIWNEWADEIGNLGPIYGKQWRSWPSSSDLHYDQLKDLMRRLKDNPNSRRHIISAWNVADLPDENQSPQANVKNKKMALAPCHVLFQFYVINRQLSCQVYLRSQDFFLGTPFNIASYAFLTHMIAQQLDLQVAKLIWLAGDVHIYSNHVKQAEQQLTREPLSPPRLEFNRKPPDLFSYEIDDFSVADYHPHPAIKAEIAV